MCIRYASIFIISPWGSNRRGGPGKKCSLEHFVFVLLSPYAHVCERMGSRDPHVVYYAFGALYSRVREYISSIRDGWFSFLHRDSV